MTYDLQLAYNCPHLAVDEKVSLASDNQTLLTRRLVSSAGLIKVKINGVTIPPSGLNTSASLISTSKSSYYFSSTQELTLTSQSSSVTLVFPKGLLTAQDFVTKITLEAKGVCTASLSEGYVTLKESRALGSASKLKLSGSAVETLGFSFQPQSRGKQVYPAWTLISAETNPESGEVYGRRVYFLDPLNNPNLIVQATYSMISSRCLRCQGLVVENDYRYDGVGDIRRVENENLLQQRCLKILLTDRGSNVFHNWYGSSLRTRVGAKAIGAVEGALRVDVERALETLRDIQDQQGGFQTMTAKERLIAVVSVEVAQLENDPTAFIIDVVVRNGSNENVNITAVYTSPGVTAYLNDNLVFGG